MVLTGNRELESELDKERATIPLLYRQNQALFTRWQIYEKASVGLTSAPLNREIPTSPTIDAAAILLYFAEVRLVF